MNNKIATIKNVAALLWQDISHKCTAWWITGTIVTTIGGMWAYPLQNLVPSGQIQSDSLWTIRIIGTGSLVALWLIAFLILIFRHYAKFKESQKTYIAPESSIDIPSVINQPTFSTTDDAILLELAQKSYKGRDPRKLKDTINSFAISEFEKYSLFEKVVLIDRGRPPKSNPFKKKKDEPIG